MMSQILTRIAQTVSIDPGEINIPKGGANDSILAEGLKIVFGISAAVAFLIVAISAFRIVISRGKSEDVGKARDAIIYAGIGLAVSMLAFVIVTFVLESL